MLHDVGNDHNHQGPNKTEENNLASLFKLKNEVKDSKQ